MRKRLIAIILSFIVLSCAFIPVYAINEFIPINAILNIYVDNTVQRQAQLSLTGNKNFLYIIYDNEITRDDLNTYANIKGYIIGTNYSNNETGYFLTSGGIYSDNFINENLFINLDYVICKCGDFVSKINIIDSQVGQLKVLKFSFAQYNGIITDTNNLHPYDIMMYTDSLDNNSNYRKVNLQLADGQELDWLWICENLTPNNISKYETLTRANLWQMEYIKGMNSYLNDDLVEWGQWVCNGYTFNDELGTASLVSGMESQPIISMYKVNDSYWNNDDLPVHPLVGQTPENPEEPPNGSSDSTPVTVPTTPTLPSIGGDLNDNDKTTLLAILDHLFFGMSEIMSGLLNNCIVFGVPLLTIIGVCLLIVVIIILVKVALR